MSNSTNGGSHCLWPALYHYPKWKVLGLNKDENINTCILVPEDGTFKGSLSIMNGMHLQFRLEVNKPQMCSNTCVCVCTNDIFLKNNFLNSFISMTQTQVYFLLPLSSITLRSPKAASPQDKTKGNGAI